MIVHKILWYLLTMRKCILFPSSGEWREWFIQTGYCFSFYVQKRFQAYISNFDLHLHPFNFPAHASIIVLLLITSPQVKEKHLGIQTELLCHHKASENMENFC